MKTRAALIKNNELYAHIDTELKSGTKVKASYKTCKEAINANRELNLVDAVTLTVSRAQKYLNEYTETFATEINDSENEFLLQDLHSYSEE
jgi:cupin superfamily acireductone dioxygenase involved in methionine salvage